ncbi:MAG: phosphatase PAP2 family protein [Planctomycetota bacterium]
MQRLPTTATWDSRTCLAFNDLNRTRPWSLFFATVSRLGDGVFWYSLMLVLPIYDGWAGAGVSLRMALTGAIGTLIYLALKHRIRRPRPCDSFAVCRTVEPLDRFSFPSGHTLHAVCFSIIVCGAYPALLHLLLPFAILVACSRMVLGLHYPTDVLCGFAIGCGLGLLSNGLVA